jgi:hypothetical protein
MRCDARRTGIDVIVAWSRAAASERAFESSGDPDLPCVAENERLDIRQMII